MLDFYNFRGIAPAINPLRLNRGQAASCKNLSFRTGIFEPGDKYTEFENVTGDKSTAKSIVPNLANNGVRRESVEAEWIIVNDRLIITKDGSKPTWTTSRNSDPISLGFSKGDKVNLTIPAHNSTAPTNPNGGKRYLIGVTILNSKGDESSMQVIWGDRDASGNHVSGEGYNGNGIVTDQTLTANDTTGITVTVNKYRNSKNDSSMPADGAPPDDEEYNRIRFYSLEVVGINSTWVMFNEQEWDGTSSKNPSAQFAPGKIASTQTRVTDDGSDKSPPSGLRGIHFHQNGFAIAYAGSELVFSEIRNVGRFPIAWRYDVGFAIDAIQVFENVVYIFDKNKERRPLVAFVNHPSSVFIREVETAFRYNGGSARVNRDVLYCAPEGIVSMRSGLLLTAGRVDESVMPSPIRAAAVEDNYFVWFNGGTAWRLDFRPVTGAAFEITEIEPSLWTIEWNKSVYFLGTDRNVYTWRGSGGNATWKSGVLRQVMPITKGNLVVYYEPTTQESYEVIERIDGGLQDEAVAPQNSGGGGGGNPVPSNVNPPVAVSISGDNHFYTPIRRMKDENNKDKYIIGDYNLFTEINRASKWKINIKTYRDNQLSREETVTQDTQRINIRRGETGNIYALPNFTHEQAKDWVVEISGEQKIERVLIVDEPNQISAFPPIPPIGT